MYFVLHLVDNLLKGLTRQQIGEKNTVFSRQWLRKDLMPQINIKVNLWIIVE